MPKRKKFDDLTKRQQSRRLAENLRTDLEELDELSNLYSETHFVTSTEERELSNLTNFFEIKNTVPNINEQVPDEKQLSTSKLVDTTNTVDNFNINPLNSDEIHPPTSAKVNNIIHTYYLENNVEKYYSVDIDADDNEAYDKFLSTLSIDDNLNVETETMFSDILDSEDESDNTSDNESSDYIDLSYEEKSKDLKTLLREWYWESGCIPREHMNKLLTILRKVGHEELPKDSRSLLKTPRKTIIQPCPPGEYFHYGVENSLKGMLSRITLNEEINIDVNIDGLPITKSTNRTLWPIQGKIVNSAFTTPFVIGVYHGNSKPETVSSYLLPFIREYEKLNSEGFIYDNRKYTVTLRCVICDSPARSYCTSTIQYNGTFGCGKCTVEGQFIDGRMVFLNEKAELRTDESFRKRFQLKHHKGESPFELISIDMVKQFPIDYMHLVCLGVTKLLLTLWMKIVPKFSVNQTKNLSTSFTNLTKFIPSDFNRKPQSLFEVKRWKATVFRLFLLYVGPVILPSSLPDDYVIHFNTLSYSIRILCDRENCSLRNEYAAELLVYFVEEFKNLYGKKYVTSNVHNLIHLPQDVANYGPLDNFSAFEFENYMQFLKKLLRKNEKPLQQIHRRLAENIYPSKKNVVESTNCPILLSRTNITLPYNCDSSHRKLKLATFELSTSAPNNCCILNDNNIIIIKFIGKQFNQPIIIGRKILKKIQLKHYPSISITDNICECEDLSELEIFKAENIIKKACLFIHKNKMYVVPLLHH